MDSLARVQANLVSQGLFPVTPLSCHWVLKHAPSMPTDWNYWQHYSRALLRRCDSLVVVDVEGWRQSTGVQAEIALARELDLPCYIVNDRDFVLIPLENFG